MKKTFYVTPDTVLDTVLGPKPAWELLKADIAIRTEDTLDVVYTIPSKVSKVSRGFKKVFSVLFVNNVSCNIVSPAIVKDGFDKRVYIDMDMPTKVRFLRWFLELPDNLNLGNLCHTKGQSAYLMPLLVTNNVDDTVLIKIKTDANNLVLNNGLVIYSK